MRKSFFTSFSLFLTLVLLAGCGKSEPSTNEYVPDDSTSYEDEVQGGTNSDEELVALEEEASSTEDASTTETEVEEEYGDQYQETSEPENDDAVDLPEDFWIDTFWGEQTKEGYNLEFSTRVTNLISFDAPNTARAAWEELGGDFSELPDMQQLKNAHPYWRGGNFSTGYYIMGSFTIENNTDGFHFSEDNSYNMLTYGTLTSRAFYEGLTPGYLTVNGETVDDPLGAAVLYVYGGSEVKTFGGSNSSIFIHNDVRNGIDFVSPTMKSDVWGPRRFVIFMPDAKTPNQPDGYDSLNNLVWSNCSPHYSIEDFTSLINAGEYSSVSLKKILSD